MSAMQLLQLGADMSVRFSVWMAVGIVLFGPVIVLLHEIGHAIPLLWMTGDPVEIRIGPDPDWYSSLGNLSIGVDHWGWTRAWLGRTVPASDPSTRSQRSIVLIGGPLVTAIVLIGLLWLRSNISHPIWSELVDGVFWYAIWALVLSLIPVGLPGGYTSDTKHLITVFRGGSLPTAGD